VNLYHLISAETAHPVRQGRIVGAVPAIVTNNQDPDGMGRVKVSFPWLSEEDESQWARVVAPMAGKERGTYFLPEVDDEVLVVFQHGDIRFPFVLGALWNGKDAPPATNDDGKNNLRMIKSRSGHVIRLNDEDGKETVEIVDKTGKNSIVFDAAKNTVTIASDQDIELKAPKGKLKVEAKEVEIKSSSTTTVEASGDMTLKGATVNLN
jgi:phage baseplate assembly protein V